MHTVAIIVEDCNKMLEESKHEALINDLFPPICALISPQYSEEVVSNAINTINMLLMTDAEMVIKNKDEYFTVILELGLKMISNPGHMKAKWRVIQGITTFIEINLTIIINNF